ncbi:MAG: HAD-IA family hydrolase [Clostridia bacterium]|nr:HAD-IA family hydrolase [Clostridia bacterium]
MKITGAIFDMDGTLLNSMDYWGTVGEDFLRRNNLISKAGDNRRFLEWGMREFYKYIVKEFGVTKSYDEVHKEIYSIMDEHYRHNVALKDGAYEMLEKLYNAGVKMCLATATDRNTVMIVLKRLQLEKYFSKIFTSGEVGVGKAQPKIYELALEHLGTDKESTYVFEDAYYAINTAHNAGFNVVGIYDKNVFATKDEVKALCDIYLDEGDRYNIDFLLK